VFHGVITAQIMENKYHAAYAPINSEHCENVEPFKHTHTHTSSIVQ